MENNQQPAVNNLDFDQPKLNPKLIIGLVLIILAGTGTGFGLSRLPAFSRPSTSSKELSFNANGEVQIRKGETYGEIDDLFTDEATGVIEENIDQGEGTHKLIREGGESQTAYLTSSLVDLDLFIGRKVKVWGETFAAQQVGWLMDVGAVKVLE